MIDAVDVNKNGEVEFDEFCEILKKQRNKNVYAAPLDLAMVFGPKEIENLRRQFIKVLYRYLISIYRSLCLFIKVFSSSWTQMDLVLLKKKKFKHSYKW
jgi:hypothetical protein